MFGNCCGLVFLCVSSVVCGVSSVSSVVLVAFSSVSCVGSVSSVSSVNSVSSAICNCGGSNITAASPAGLSHYSTWGTVEK